MTAIEKLTYSVGDRIIIRRDILDHEGDATGLYKDDGDGRKRTIKGFYHVSWPGGIVRASAINFDIDAEVLLGHSPDSLQAFEWQKGILTSEGNTVIVVYKCEGDLEFYDWNIFNDEVKKYVDNV